MKLTLLARKSEAAGVESFIFKPEEPLRWRAGQFLHYVLHHEPTDDRGSDRWFTVSSAPSEGHVMLTTRVTAEGVQSSFKKALIALEVGKETEVSAVEGDFTLEGVSGPLVFIAGGIGVTPFRSILKELDHTGASMDITLLYGNRDEDIPFKAELDEIAAKGNGLTIHYLVGQKLDEVALRAHITDLADPTFYVSGPEPMVEALFATLKGMGAPESHLKGDWFPGYSAQF